MSATRIHVVGAVFQNPQGEFLCALRSGQMSNPFVWEFPGGKIEPGETPQQALVREIREEFGCDISVGEQVGHALVSYPDFDVHLVTYAATVLAGALVAQEHLRVLWLPKEALLSLKWGAADRPTVYTLMGE